MSALDEQEDDGRDGEDEAVDALGVLALDGDRGRRGEARPVGRVEDDEPDDRGHA